MGNTDKTPQDERQARMRRYYAERIVCVRIKMSDYQIGLLAGGIIGAVVEAVGFLLVMALVYGSSSERRE